MNIVLLNAGIRMFLRRIKIKIHGLPKYKGNAEEICKKIVERCWNNKEQFFLTSRSNYTEFYCRDFGMVTKALIYLKYKDKVKKTLDFALKHFKKNNKITVMLDKKGRGTNFPYYAPDSLAFILHSLYELKDKKLVNKYKEFLEFEIKKFEKIVIDKKNHGLPKKSKFSSMRDFSIRKGSCYDLCMIYLVQRYSRLLKLKNNIQKYDYKKLIIKNYWTGYYFRDDLVTNNFSSDANILPYWSGLIKDKKMFNQSLKYIKYKNLDTPFPIKYSQEKDEKMHWLEFLVPNWERDKLWIHLGYLFIETVNKFNKKKALLYINEYQLNIENYKNQLEIFEKDGKPYKSIFFYCGDSMIWSANFVWLKNIIK